MESRDRERGRETRDRQTDRQTDRLSFKSPYKNVPFANQLGSFVFSRVREPTVRNKTPLIRPNEPVLLFGFCC